MPTNKSKRRNWSVLIPKIEKYATEHTNGNLTQAAKHFKVSSAMFFSKRFVHKGPANGGTSPTKNKKADNATLPTLNGTTVAIMICPIDSIKDVVNNLW